MSNNTTETEQYDYIYKYKDTRYHYKIQYTPKTYSDGLTYWLGDIPNRINRSIFIRKNKKRIKENIRDRVNYPGLTSSQIDSIKWNKQMDLIENTELTSVLLILSSTVAVILFTVLTRWEDIIASLFDFIFTRLNL